MGRKKAADDDAKPDFEQVPLKVIAPDYWPEIERNKKNLIDVGLWFSLLVVFEPRNDHRLRAFVKSSCYGALDEVQMMDRLLPFDIDAVSRCLRLPQEGMTMGGVAHFKEDDLSHVFESNAKTVVGYALAKAKGIYKEWLSYVNHRILLPLSPEHISEEGIAAALMALQGMPLNWSKIIYNNIKLELMRKRTRGVLALYSVVYLTKIMDPTQPPIPSPPPINLTTPITTEVGSTS
jgi:hypothetical protein